MTLALGMETFGRSLGSREAPITLAEGRPARPRARWPRAVRSGCEGPAPPGAVCVPGGAFWMGSPDDPVFPNLLAPRVVAVSAFYLDRTEVTVRDYRERVGAGPLPRAWSGSLAGTRADDFCTYTPEPGRFDDFAVNCISWQSARSYCVALGGDLPTEAQREYVASALQGLPYLWGRDRPSCADAFLAAGPRSERFSPTAGAYHTSCRATTPRDDLEAIGFSRPVTGLYGRDALALPGGVVQDLVGNLAEWVRDDWQPRSGSCWSDPRVLVDPTCVVDPSAPRTLRGGSWVGATVDSDAWLRQPLTDEPGTTGLAIGFRCAYVTK